MSSDAPRLHQSADGELTLSWFPGVNAGDYTVELIAGEQTLWSQTLEGPCPMPELRLPEEVTLRISTRTYLESRLDPDEDTLLLTWSKVPGGVNTVTDEQGTVLEVTSGSSVLMPFGGEDLPMLRKDETWTFALNAGLDGWGVEFTSDITASRQILGEDLPGTALYLTLTDLGYNRYTLAWNETRGERYELQELQPDGSWSTLLLRRHGLEPCHRPPGPLHGAHLLDRRSGRAYDAGKRLRRHPR